MKRGERLQDSNEEIETGRITLHVVIQRTKQGFEYSIDDILLGFVNIHGSIYPGLSKRALEDNIMARYIALYPDKKIAYFRFIYSGENPFAD